MPHESNVEYLTNHKDTTLELAIIHPDPADSYDAAGQWIPTPLERENRRAEQEHQRAERPAARLRALGIEPDEKQWSDSSILMDKFS